MKVGKRGKHETGNKIERNMYWLLNAGKHVTDGNGAKLAPECQQKYRTRVLDDSNFGQKKASENFKRPKYLQYFINLLVAPKFLVFFMGRTLAETS